VDNVEQVVISLPAGGTYTVRVSADHLGPDEYSQDFAMVVTGAETLSQKAEGKTGDLILVDIEAATTSARLLDAELTEWRDPGTGVETDVPRSLTTQWYADRVLLKDGDTVIGRLYSSLGTTEDPEDIEMVGQLYLAPAIEDPSAMVRCRLVELLAASASKGHRTIVRHLAGDKDELVRDMARLFLRP